MIFKYEKHINNIGFHLSTTKQTFFHWMNFVFMQISKCSNYGLHQHSGQLYPQSIQSDSCEFSILHNWDSDWDNSCQAVRL